MPVLVFDEFIPAKQSAAGKMMPPKAKAGGTTFALNKSVVDLIENSIGTPLDCETKTEQNGKYTNHFVLSARHLASASATPTRAVGSTDTRPTAPPTTSLPSPTEAVVTPAASHPPYRDARSDEINRQSARRDAVSLVVAGIYPPDQLFTLIDKLADYTYHSPEKSAPRTIAQQHLDVIREKQADIRSTYADEDAVCPNCGRREWIKQWSGGWACMRSKEAGVPGGCGFPPKGERLDSPVTYGEFKQRTTNSVPWKD